MNRQIDNPEDHDSVPEPKGCLAALLRLLGISLQPSEPTVRDDALPYRLSERFLSPAELSFYKVLRQVVPQEFTVAVKPRLGDLLFVPRTANGRWAFQNKIQSKHVDFLICDSQAMTPRLVIELDDKSHDRSDRRERDNFVDEAFRVAGLEVVHVRVQASYVPFEISNMLETKLRNSVSQQSQLTDPDSHQCPNCGTPLVQRTAGKGRNKGGMFWGCPNYPNCRHVQ